MPSGPPNCPGPLPAPPNTLRSAAPRSPVVCPDVMRKKPWVVPSPVSPSLSWARTISRHDEDPGPVTVQVNSCVVSPVASVAYVAPPSRLSKTSADTTVPSSVAVQRIVVDDPISRTSPELGDCTTTVGACPKSPRRKRCTWPFPVSSTNNSESPAATQSSGVENDTGSSSPSTSTTEWPASSTTRRFRLYWVRKNLPAANVPPVGLPISERRAGEANDSTKLPAPVITTMRYPPLPSET